MDLESLGWDASYADAFRPFEQDGLAPARVAVEHRIDYVVYTQHGELRAELSGKLRHDEEHPAVGDWVAIAPRADEGRATIHAVVIDTRAAKLTWKGDVIGDAVRTFSPAVAAGIAGRVADLFTAPAR